LSPHVPSKSRTTSTATLREKARGIVDALRLREPQPRVELDHQDPFQLLVATILSAQCTDARVNKVTPELFRRWPTPQSMAAAEPVDLIPVIRSAGFFNTKSRSLVAASRTLVERHGGEVPRNLEALAALPGVGRKTANVVLGAAYGIASGIVVDTHMARVSQRLGLTRQSDPERIERDLMALVPQASWVFFSISMVLHGRYVCTARQPACAACVLNALCPSRDRVAAHPPRRRPRGRGRG
jgi:endonuclease-3